jgi:hypothetical protein
MWALLALAGDANKSACDEHVCGLEVRLGPSRLHPVRQKPQPLRLTSNAALSQLTAIH